MIIALLGFVDLLAGLTMLFPEPFGFMAFWLGVFLLFKSATSLFGSLAEPMIAILGLIDLVVALTLIFSWNIPWLWLIALMKGSWSIMAGFASTD